MKARVLLLVLAVTAAVNAVTFPYIKKLNVPFYSQKNLAWSGEPIGLGGCGETIGSKGCFITATTMVLDCYGWDFNPKTFNEWLKQNGGYGGSDGCQFRYLVVNDSNLHYIEKPKTQIIADQIAHEIDEGNPVIAATTSDGDHWYVIVGYERTEDGGLSWFINDPLLSSGLTKSTFSLADNYRFFSEPGKIDDLVGLFPGSVRDNLTPLFKAAYQADMGFPIDNGGGTCYVHNWNGRWIQDFRTPDGKIKHLIYNDEQNAVHLLQGGIAGYWFGHYGELGSYAPIGEEKAYTYVGRSSNFFNRGVACVMQELGTTTDNYPQKTIVWNASTGVTIHFPVGIFEVDDSKVGLGKVVDVTDGGYYELPPADIINGNLQYLVGVGLYKYKIVRSDGSVIGYLEHTVTEGNDQVWSPDIPINPSPDTPVLFVSATNFDFGTNLNQLSFQIKNNGTGTLNWSIANNPNWLSLSPSSGSLSVGQETTVYLNLNRALLSSGTNLATPNISSNGGSQQFSVQATFNSQPPPTEQPVLDVYAAWTDFDLNYTELNFWVKNSGTGTLNWNASFDKSWGVLSLTNGELGPGKEIEVKLSLQTQYLAYGENFGTLTVSGNGGSAQKTFRAVGTIKPQPPSDETPVLWLSVASLDFGANCSQLEITVKNTGKGTLNWTVVSDRNWVSFSSTNGSLAANAQTVVEVSLDRTPLGIGVSNANISFSGNGGDINLLLSVMKESPSTPPTSTEPQDLSGEAHLINNALRFSGSMFGPNKYDILFLAGPSSLQTSNFNDGDGFTLPANTDRFNFAFSNNASDWFWVGSDGQGRGNCIFQGFRFHDGWFWINEPMPITRVNTYESVPLLFSLLVYPNPFNPETTISYSLPHQGNIKLSIYDMLGREMETLVNGKMATGEHTVRWNAENLPSGIYVAVLKTEEGSRKMKMLLMK